MTHTGRLIVIVDDNESVRESLPDLLRHAGYTVAAFASAEDFLAADVAGDTSCMVLDVGLPGMSGPDLHQQLIRRGQAVPTVFITAHDDASLHRRLVAAGAVACLHKPFTDTALLAAVDSAISTTRA